jgi:hypothetical protein
VSESHGREQGGDRAPEARRRAHDDPAGPAGEKLMLKIAQIGAVGAIVVLTVLPLPASAYCACACVNGKAQAQ